jgi:hypothetical protein
VQQQYRVAAALVEVVQAQPVEIEPVRRERIVRQAREALVRCAEGLDRPTYAGPASETADTL